MEGRARKMEAEIFAKGLYCQAKVFTQWSRQSGDNEEFLLRTVLFELWYKNITEADIPEEKWEKWQLLFHGYL